MVLSKNKAGRHMGIGGLDLVVIACGVRAVRVFVASACGHE